MLHISLYQQQQEWEAFFVLFSEWDVKCGYHSN